MKRRDEDVLVLTETSAGEGSLHIARTLDDWGFTVVWQQPVGDRGVLLATRLPIRAQLFSDELALPWRIAGVELDYDPALAVLGVYVPSRERSARNVAKKQSFIESFIDAVGGLAMATRQRLVIGGDYNAVSRRHVPARYGFIDCEYALHDELERLGFAAGHELARSARQPHSWIGRTGDGYLYDYFHLGQHLHDRLSACRYLHGPRQRGLTDHAAVTLALT